MRSPPPRAFRAPAAAAGQARAPPSSPCSRPPPPPPPPRPVWRRITPAGGSRRRASADLVGLNGRPTRVVYLRGMDTLTPAQIAAFEAVLARVTPDDRARLH